MLQSVLAGRADRGSFICDRWELRITGRCLEEDLARPADAAFENVAGLEIVKALVSERSSRTESTRRVSPLSSGHDIWVLARGHEHRGGTFFDQEARVVWLVAYGRHRSGSKDDFFPYCKDLDREDRLLPTKDDYERLLRDRDTRFARTVSVEAPLLLKRAREERGEQRAKLGGELGACLAIEVADNLEATTIAFEVETIEFDLVPLVLAAFHDGAWESVGHMPSRDLEPNEVAFIHVHTVEL
jgi:hypothetical protein